jgi:pimeloyl-ACP methyl ester carboxylesterase
MDKQVWTSASVEVNDVRLAYHRTGGDKPQVVLAHGFSDNGLCWARLATALETEYDMIMVDARGHGNSTAPATGYSDEVMAADLAGVIESLALVKPAIVGHSMGASVAAMLLAREPGLTSGAVLEDPPWRRSTGPDSTSGGHGFAPWLTRLRAMTLAEVQADGRRENPMWDATEFEEWARAKHQISPAVVARGSASAPPYAEVVAGIREPVLLVRGDPDLGGIVTDEVATEVTRVNPLVVDVRLSPAGHSIRREQFDRYVSVVREFLAGLFG